jgi:hypothetical protein
LGEHGDKTAVSAIEVDRTNRDDESREVVQSLYYIKTRLSREVDGATLEKICAKPHIVKIREG